MAKYLFLFTISPVQSFILQASKTRDLKAGSDILSDLISYAIESIKENTPQIIFPAEKNASKPNRFIAELEFENESEVSEFGETLSKRIREKFRKIAEEVFKKECKGTEYPGNFEQQIEDFLEVYWAARPLGADYQKTYSEIERLLASVKNVKAFRQITEKGRKCSVCGERNGLFYAANKNGKKPAFTQEDAIRLYELKSSETLCAVCFMKRNYKTKEMEFPSTADIALMGNFERIISKIADAGTKTQLKNIKEKEPAILLAEKLEEEEEFENLPALGMDYDEIKKLWEKFRDKAKDNKIKISRYYGLLMFDGDKMGNWLSGANLPEKGRLREFHEIFTAKLGEYAENAQNYLDSNNRGKTVYAGGDDFLGFLNLENLFSTLHELRMMFDRQVNQPLGKAFNLEKPITFSAGITVAHYKTPLRIVLQRTREMEKKAKDKGDRDAFAICVMKHSGEILESYLKWAVEKQDNIGIITHIINELKSEKFSSTFIRAIQEEFGLKLTADKIGRNPFDAELKRLIDRSFNLKKEEKKEPVEKMTEKVQELLTNCNYDTERFFSIINILVFMLRESA